MPPDKKQQRRSTLIDDVKPINDQLDALPPPILSDDIKDWFHKKPMDVPDTVEVIS